MSQDFSNQNLRGRSFQGQDLTNADFSYADLRGANFRGAILNGANFSYAKAGLKRRRSASVAIGAFLLSGFPDLALRIINLIFFIYLFQPEILKNADRSLPNLLFLTLLIVFVISIIRKGLAPALKTIALSIAIVLIIATILAFIQPNVAAIIFIDVVIVQLILLACIAMSAVLSIAIAVGGIAIALYFVIQYCIVNLAGNLFFRNALFQTRYLFQLGNAEIPIDFTSSTAIALAFNAVLSLLSVYIGWKAAVGDPGFALLRRIVIPIVTIGGTSFRDADLTDANFTRARLKGADLRGAMLVRTCWRKVRKLSLARLGNSYLQDDRIRQLVIRGEGQNQNFERTDLRRINLNGANLSGADLAGADLSETTLQSSNLFGARLVRSRFDRADLSEACLTGIVLEDWTGMRNARLDKVECKYVFLASLNREAPERIPPQEDFQPDEFRIFSRSVLDTLDIYHNRDLNPQTAEAALNSLAADYFSGKADRLELVALQETEDKAIIKLRVPEQANRALLLAEYFARYFPLLHAGSGQSASDVLPAGACNITRLSELFEALSQHPSETLYFYNNEPLILGEMVNTSIDKRRIQKIDMGGGNLIASGAGALSTGDISGIVANTILPQQAEPAIEPESATLRGLLLQVQDAIAATPNLIDTERAEALRQTDLLHIIVSGAWEKTIEQQASRAIKILKGITMEVPTATRFAELCKLLNLPEFNAADIAPFQQRIEQLKQEIETAPEFTADLKTDALEQVEILTKIVQYFSDRSRYEKGNKTLKKNDTRISR